MKNNDERIAEIGSKVYFANKEELEKNHWKEFVVIDPDKEKIIAIAPTALKAMNKAREIEHKIFFMRQIGVDARL